MGQTIKETIDCLIGTVIIGGGRFNSGETVKGIPALHPKTSDYVREKCDSAKSYRDHLKKEGVLDHPLFYDPDFDDGLEISTENLISIINERSLVVKALVKVSGSDPTTMEYHRAADEVVDVGLRCEDNGKYAGYDLVLWGDL